MLLISDLTPRRGGREWLSCSPTRCGNAAQGNFGSGGIGLALTLIFYLLDPRRLGLSKPLRVVFDNAALIPPGAPVTLAGRKVGHVSDIRTPLPLAERPPGKSNYEAMIVVQVDPTAELYKEMTVTMRSFRPQGDPVIDFTGGNPVSGRCAPNDTYVGVREYARTDNLSGPDLEKIDPALVEVQRLLGTLRAAVQNLVDLTGQDSALVGVIRNLDGVVSKLRTLGSALPKLDGILDDLKQLTGKRKGQPWRLIYPTTIKYPSPAASPPPVKSLLIRKSR